MAIPTLDIPPALLIAALAAVLILLAAGMIRGLSILHRLDDLEIRFERHVDEEHRPNRLQPGEPASPAPHWGSGDRLRGPTLPLVWAPERSPQSPSAPPMAGRAGNEPGVAAERPGPIEPVDRVPAAPVTPDRVRSEFRRICEAFPAPGVLAPDIERRPLAFRQEVRDGFGILGGLVFEDDVQVAGFIRIGAVAGSEAWLFADPAARHAPVIEMVFPEVTSMVLASPPRLAGVPPALITRRADGLWEMRCQTS